MRLAARGIAFAAKADIAAAKVEQQAYLAAVPLVPPEETAGPNTGRAMSCAVVTPMLAGEILYRDGKVDEGLSKLRDAVKAEDALRYSEPPGWICRRAIHSAPRSCRSAALLRPNRCIETTSRACRKTAGPSSASRRASTARVKRKKPSRPTLVSGRYGLRQMCRSRAPASVSREPERTQVLLRQTNQTNVP